MDIKSSHPAPAPENRAETATRRAKAQLNAPARALATAPAGPIAVLYSEDTFLVSSSVAWAARRGAAALLAVGEAEGVARALAAAARAGLPAEGIASAAARGRAGAAAHLGALCDLLPGRWLLPMFNGEFPAFPWFEGRKLEDLAQFQDGERRGGVGGWVVDLHAPGLADAAEAGDPDWSPPEETLFELGGCFALTSAAEPWEAPGAGPVAAGAPRLYGGVGWRFQERLGRRPPRLDRTVFLKARKGMRFDETFRCGDPAVDGLSGEWHRSPTMAVMSFRAARALLAEPEVAANPPALAWSGARPWRWSSGELLDAGVIEPGQWF